MSGGVRDVRRRHAPASFVRFIMEVSNLSPLVDNGRHSQHCSRNETHLMLSLYPMREKVCRQLQVASRKNGNQNLICKEYASFSCEVAE